MKSTNPKYEPVFLRTNIWWQGSEVQAAHSTDNYRPYPIPWKGLSPTTDEPSAFYSPIQSLTSGHKTTNAFSSVLMCITKLMVTNVCAQERAELRAAETVPMSKERGLGYVWRGAHATHSWDVWVHLLLSTAASHFLQFAFKRGEGKHTRNQTWSTADFLLQIWTEHQQLFHKGTLILKGQTKPKTWPHHLFSGCLHAWKWPRHVVFSLLGFDSSTVAPLHQILLPI